ncbi:shikimate dehydrogenase family protein [Metabacillus sediminilitoris]|uniref:Shikimate dehydrogenase n=1 Tax=Metabacillus sediminilitoris TaxID=2567941 RepID=A0A4S4C0N8_9BACI|nr:shikimate dehydrogenase [Metabacillus sediminilitoris]QGQ47776.1 shikimate dehydrogenase [Metabacillus sediminilitoris]THF81111.1 shikimate dehydrogenase [Metabacillus sediminilitoris]
MKLPEKATQPTMYFIGVTTTKSSIMKLFPLWAEALGLENAVLKGIDIDIHADPQVYRDVVQFIKDDELSLGALVTTHKIDLYHAAKDLFDYFDPYATMFGELSSISKKDGRLEGYAKDPISSGLAMEAFIPENYWNNHGGELFIIGAGGSAIAISSYLLDRNKGKNIPSRVVITDLNKERLEEIKRIISEINPDVNVEYHLTQEPSQNDALLTQLKPYSYIINATGLGKDRPGSPLTETCIFPKDSFVWELNYRGKLDFFHQALRQKESRNLYIEDGWIYFIHGWTQVIAEVFHIDITGSVFDKIEQISNETR